MKNFKQFYVKVIVKSSLFYYGFIMAFSLDHCFDWPTALLRLRSRSVLRYSKILCCFCVNVITPVFM